MVALLMLQRSLGNRGSSREAREDSSYNFSPTLRRGSRLVFPWGVWGGPPGTWPRPRAQRRQKPGGRRRKTAPFRRTRFRTARAAPRWSARWSKRATSRRLSGPDGPGSPQDGPGGLQDAPRGLQESLQEGLARQMCSMSFGFFDVFRVSAFSAFPRSETAQEAPKVAPRRPKRPPRRPPDVQRGP